MNENERDAVLRERFASRALRGPSAALRERVMAVPERRIHVRRSWPVAWSRGMVPGPRIALVVAVVSMSLVGLWAAVGQPAQPPVSFSPSSIAYVRDGDMYVAPLDGTRETLVEAGDSGDGGEIWWPEIAPDGRSIAFIRMTDAPRRARLYIETADGRTLGTFDGRYEMQTSWAPDGRRIAVLGDGDDSAIVGLDGRRLASITLPDAWSTTYVYGNERASWSPDGRWIAVPGCATPCEPKHDLRFLLVAADGSGLLNAEPAQSPPDGPGSILIWALDARFAVIQSEPQGSGPPSIKLLSRDGALLHRILLPAGIFVEAAAWSPDGTKLVVAGNTGVERRGQLIVIGSDGISRDVPMDPAWLIDDVAWSDDGRSLRFAGVSSPPAAGDPCCATSLWEIDADGGHQRLLIGDFR